MRTRAIAGYKVSAIGLGGMPMSLEGRPDEDQAIRTIHAALDGGVTFIDTADAYCISDKEIGHNERLIAKPSPRGLGLRPSRWPLRAGIRGRATARGSKTVGPSI